MSVWRILIAGDEPDFQDELRARVSQFEHGQDYAVSTASDGPAALQAVMREVTGTLKKGDAAAALKRAAFFYLPKPFAVQYIGALVAIVLRYPQARS